jgi:hypothetical protein
MLNFLQELVEAVFNPEIEKRRPWFGWLWLSGLYLGVAVLWAKFLNYGKIPFDFLDWAEVSAARYAFLRDAVIKGVLPLHMPDASALRGITDRFMSVPDVTLSPQVLLLRFMDVGPFLLVNLLLLYTLGALGLLVLRRRFSLSLASFSILFILFNLNGYLQSHFAVGHINYTGYFLFPWLAVLVFQLLEGERSWAWVTKISLLLFFIFLQGSFHHYIWGLMFLGLLGITSWKHFVPVLKALVASVLLSMVRILPPALDASKFDSGFLGGYPTVLDIWKSLTTIVFPQDALSVRNALNPLGWWEFDLYIGLAGALFLVYFGIFRWLKQGRKEAGFPELVFPLTMLSILSVGSIYQLVHLLPIPLLAGERVSSRFISLPFAFLLILAAIEFQHWLDEKPKPVVAIRLAWLGVFAVIFNDLWQHLKVWQVTATLPFFPVTPVNLAIKVVANHADPPYIAAIAVGAAVTLVSLFALLFLTWRENHPRKQGANQANA